VPEAPSPSPFSLTLVFVGLFLLHLLTPLPAAAQHFLPFLKYVTREALLVLRGSALASYRSILEPAGAGSVRLVSSFWYLLTEATPAAPHYQNLAT